MKKILSVFMVVVSMISCIFGMTCYASEYEKDELREIYMKIRQAKSLVW